MLTKYQNIYIYIHIYIYAYIYIYMCVCVCMLLTRCIALTPKFLPEVNISVALTAPPHGVLIDTNARMCFLFQVLF